MSENYRKKLTIKFQPDAISKLTYLDLPSFGKVFRIIRVYKLHLFVYDRDSEYLFYECSSKRFMLEILNSYLEWYLH